MTFPDYITYFLKRHHISIINTLNDDNRIYAAVKGILKVDGDLDKITIMDLFKGQTYKNILKNPTASLTVVSEREYVGYNLQGKAKTVAVTKEDKINIELWESKLLSRISERIQTSVQKGVKSQTIHETKLFLEPKHMFEITVDNIIDLSLPKH